MRWIRLILSAMAAAVLAGCATPRFAVDVSGSDVERNCRALIAAADDVVSRRGVIDAQAPMVAGFPYLRVDRFLSSWRSDLDTEAKFQEWADRLRTLDQRARRLELANLSPADRSTLARGSASSLVLEQEVEQCAELLRREHLRVPGAPEMLKQRADVPDEYRTSWRVLGLYPVTSLFVSRGVSNYHADTRSTFTTPLAALPVRGKLMRFTPPGVQAGDVGAMLARASRNPLGIPTPDAETAQALLARFAPIFEIDVATRDDLVGAPRWEGDSIVIDTDDAAVYTMLSHTRFGGSTLLQLNYVLWFPSRPSSGAFDILSGHVDGLHWRVMLAPDGRVLLYDAMHNCGCYHMFFPTTALRPRASEPGVEPPLIPQFGPSPSPAERVIVRLASGTHYIERVYAETAEPARSYRFARYDNLRSLATDSDSRRSMFDGDGIVPGSERAERWLIWPMGVPAPGAMRQWGHHATAFVGRRHFDDANLLDHLFQTEAAP
jgi:hypothetical protein